MTTFGLPAASESFDVGSYEYIPAGDASCQMPNIVIQPGDSSFSSQRSRSSTPLPQQEQSSLIFDDDSDYPLVATQPLTQSQHLSYNPDIDQHLVGCLIPATTKGKLLELCKTKESREWTIGRHQTNDLQLDGMRLSNYHCKLIWNGKLGRESEVKLEDHSTNGTWINNTHVKKGYRSILRSGASISLGSAPVMANNDYRFIFRDVEGQSTRHANQFWAKYDVGLELGVGAFARVHKCIERETGLEYAVKIISKNKLQRSHLNEQAVIREISILQRLAEFRHKHIVSLHEHFEEEDSIYLILEFVSGGDLLTYLQTHGPLPEDQVRRMAAQICHAVAYVHSHGITHRDLKPENVIMTASNPPDCKVADFGLAKLVENDTFLKTQCGTPEYLAPEVMLRPDLRQGYDCRVDSWSLGIIFYCMLTNCSPFSQPAVIDNPDARERYFNDRKVGWEVLNDFHLSEDGHDFLRNMLTEDPRNRKTVACMLDHHWIAHLVPSDSQYQHPPSLPPSDSSTPPTVDGAHACSQSMETLNLSDIPIPGLSMIDQQAAKKAKNSTVPSNAVQPDHSMESFASEFSVTAKIPGAFPKEKKEGRELLVTVEEVANEGASLDFAPGPPGSSRQNPPLFSKLPVKRKSNLIAGSSPLSSLSSDESGEEGVVKKPVSRRGAATRTKGKAVEATGNKRKARPPSSTSRTRRVPPTDEEEFTVRKSSRRPPAKTPRYT